MSKYKKGPNVDSLACPKLKFSKSEHAKCQNVKKNDGISVSEGYFEGVFLGFHETYHISHHKYHLCRQKYHVFYPKKLHFSPKLKRNIALRQIPPRATQDPPKG